MERLFYLAISFFLVFAILLILLPFYLQQKKQAHSSKPFYFLIIIVVPFLALGLYFAIGNFNLQRNAWLTDSFMAQMKSPQQVIEKLKERLQQQPNSSEGWYLLGRLYLSQQQFIEAEQAFAKAVALAPKNPIILNNYGLAHYLNHHYAEAIQVWQKVLTLIPADSEDTKFVKQAIAKAKEEQQKELKKIRK